MTKRQAWLYTIFGSALFYAGLALLGHYALAEEPTKERVPVIELSCNGVSDVVLMDSGILTAGGKMYRLSHGYMNKLVFSNDVMLEGEINGDAIYFDRSTLRIGEQSYTCRAE